MAESIFVCRRVSYSMMNLWGWRGGLTFVRQFALFAHAVVGLGMIVFGCFVSTAIEHDAIRDAAVGASFFAGGFDGKYLEELTRGSELSRASLEMLDASFTESEPGRQILSVKVWRPDGSIAYTTRPDLIGTDFATSPCLQKALGGQLSAYFRNPAESEGAARSLGVPLLKTYVPIHGKDTDRIVAVAEFFTRADALAAVIKAVRLRSWVAVGGVAFFLQITSLCGFVWRSNKTTDSQRAALVGAHRAAAEINERFLRRIGADLHDGPAQLISLALLRLNGLRSFLAPEHAKSEEVEKIQALLQDCLQEIRQMSAGLAPPHLESLSLQGILELAIRQHEQRTGTTVDAVVGALPTDVSPLYKVAIYRFVQQALHNAYRHAGGVGQFIHAVSDGSTLTVQVADNGPGFAPSKNVDAERLGLAGMRDRIESLGGTFCLETRTGSGTMLRASFKLDDIIKPKNIDGAA